MLKKSILLIFSTVVLTVSASANEMSNAMIQPLDAHGITFSDVAVVANDWSEGDAEVYKYTLKHFNYSLSQSILSSLPELKNNRRALVSLTMGVMLILEQREINIGEVFRNISTHTYLVDKPFLTTEEVFVAVTTMAI